MESALHRFVRLLRLHGMRVSVSEALDAMHAAAQPGVLAERELLRSALLVTLVKDRRDVDVFHRVFDRFFGLQAVLPPEPDAHSHAHDDLSDEGPTEQFTLSDNPGDNPQQGHSHGKPDEIKSYFDPEDMAQQYNLHQEANRLDMAAMTDEIVLSNDAQGANEQAARVQLSTSRMRNPGSPGELATRPGLELDTELSVAEEMALWEWLTDELPDDGDWTEPESLAALRAALAPLLEGLPERLRDHLQQLLAVEKEIESHEIEAAQAETLDEHERADLEESLRRLLRSLHGAPRPKRAVATQGVVDGRRTMRANMKYDGVPFRPVTVRKVTDRPRLLVLTDVSLSVRSTARFTLHLVHSLQSVAAQVRSFAFVKDLRRDHRPVLRAPDRGRAVAGAGRAARRWRARRGRGLRLRACLRAVPRPVRLRRHPAYDADGAR